MTDQLILTKAQREQSLTALKEVDALLSKLNQPRHRGLESAIAMLDALPMVSGEPVAFVMGLCDESDELNVYLPTGTKLYTSPQPLKTDKTATCLIGVQGSSFDLPTTKRAYTYKEQPSNAYAHRLGAACNAANKQSVGDSIDRALGMMDCAQCAGIDLSHTHTWIHLRK